MGHLEVGRAKDLSAPPSTTTQPTGATQKKGTIQEVLSVYFNIYSSL